MRRDLIRRTCLAKLARNSAWTSHAEDCVCDLKLGNPQCPRTRKHWLVQVHVQHTDHHHWVELKLIGGPEGPRDAVGATVYLTANGMRQRGDVLSGGSYLSSNDFRIHFGLGAAIDAGSVEILWPSGSKENMKLPASERIYTIAEGKGITGAMCNDPPCNPFH